MDNDNKPHIHEVYYNKRNEVEAWTEQPIEYDKKTKKKELRWMLDALKKPMLMEVLDADTDRLTLVEYEECA